MSGILSAMTAMGLWAQSGDCGEHVTWTLDGNTITISGEGKMNNYSAAQGNPTPWEDYKTQIQEVIVNPGVTALGDYAFDQCHGVTSVSLPEGLLTIGQHAFADCTSLESITFPESLTEIGRECSRYDPAEGYVFANCSKMKSVTIPANVTLIARNTFDGCDLEQVYWNAENCTRGNYEGQDFYYTLFYKNNNLSHIHFGPTVKRIPCLLKGYGSVGFSTSGTIELVAQDCFTGTQWLLEQDFGPVYVDKCLYIYNAPPTIEDFTLEVREGTVGISSCALYKGPRITRLTVPESLRYWDRYAIGECENLKEVIWNAIDCEMLNNSTPGLAVHSPMSPFIPGLEKITFGPKVERLYDAFLKNCTEIKGLQLPASLRRIDTEAFYGMNGLEELVIPDGVEEIANYLCYNCKSLKTITFGSGLRKFDAYYSITGCPEITTVNWNVADCQMSNTMGNYVTSVTTVNFGDAVQRIPALGLKSATQVNIGNNVKELANNAFYEWAAPRIELPDGLEKIGYYALQNMPELTSLFIPASVDTLPPNAFSNCHKLETVIIAVGRPAEKYIYPSSSGVKRYAFYVPDVEAYSRNFGGMDLHPMVEVNPGTFTYDGAAHEIALTNVMPGYEAEMPQTVTVSGADAEAGQHTVWVPASFSGARPFATEVGVTYTVDKAQDKLEWVGELPALHPGDRIDITGLAKTLSGANPSYYVGKQSADGYNAAYYASVNREEDGHWYLECKNPNAMLIGCYVSWENFEPYSANWIQDRDYIYLNFDITEESGLDSISADADADVRIYSVAGVLLYTGPMADATLEPGIYVVKAGDKAHKIAVR